MEGLHRITTVRRCISVGRSVSVGRRVSVRGGSSVLPRPSCHPPLHPAPSPVPILRTRLVEVHLLRPRARSPLPDIVPTRQKHPSVQRNKIHGDSRNPEENCIIPRKAFFNLFFKIQNWFCGKRRLESGGEISTTFNPKHFVMHRCRKETR